MEEELNEHDLEERLYAMLHHVDETQNNVNTITNQIDTTQLLENGPRGTIRRYWRTSETNPHTKINNPNPHINVNSNNPYVKVNNNNPQVKVSTPKQAPVINNTTPTADKTKPKEESESPTPPAAVDLSLFQSPIPQNVNKVIQIIEHENTNQVVLESSDEDEVVEVALPPKPTITIESSDEDDITVVKLTSTKTPTKEKAKTNDRAISASPVPSVVSSVSDDFIRGDCIALNISSRQPNNPSFDFSLHGPDLVIQDTPSKKKRKRKNKEAVTSTPITAEKPSNQSEECFATPKSKAKNKKKAKTNTTIQKSISTPEIDDSDSNQSIIDITRSKNSYVVTEKSLPSADVYESDSNQSEIQVQKDKTQEVCSVSDKANTDLNKTNDSELFHTCESIVDLTGNDSFMTVPSITESIVVANVTGFTESEDYGDENQPDTTDISKYVSSKVPSILNADLDFDNLKRNEKVCKKRRYSLTTLRAEMEKFYNESWGGEDFNHREIQKNMSRDKNLWAIDPKDRMPTTYGQRKTRCNHCNRAGHRDDACLRKPAVCYMCGNSGHYESRCPSKICVNCGSPNHMFTNICRNCSSWERITCAECSQSGHPSSHCPDLWRRYHNTIDITMPLEKCFHTKQWNEMYCSGCSRRGHLVHTCRITIPFSSLPINTPYVCVYRSLYYQKSQDKQKHSQDNTISSTPNRVDKRVSKSPVAHENHTNKKRNMSVGDEGKYEPKSPANMKQIKETSDEKTQEKNPDVDSGKAPDFIPIENSSNHDNKGHVIQDNEVSDSSEVVTSARIYVTDKVYDKLKTKEHQEWLKETAKKLAIVVQCCGGAFPFLSIKGKVGDQESFQYLLRDRKWEQDETDDKTTPNEKEDESAMTHNNLPKNRHSLLRFISKALDTLKDDFGDPKTIYKELNYLQNSHKKLLNQKVINPTALSHSRTNINNVLRKLNTVLLGQAGLANGSSSVSELHSYIEKLSTHRGNTIPVGLRKEIGIHFHSIFSPNARDDYSELLKKYDVSKPGSKAMNIKPKKTSNMKKFKATPKIKSIPQDNLNSENEDLKTQKKMYMKKMVFFKNRLEHVKPKEAANKKARSELLRKLHNFILVMFRSKEKLSSKVLKKVKKTQKEAQDFLSANA